jgi:hypothetical protein
MGNTVTVGCKLPHGLHLDVAGKRVTVEGTNGATIIGGHGITRNVDKAFFEEWLRINKDSDAVKNELIFAHEKDASTAAEANEKEGNRSGFEGIDPAKPGNGVEPAKEEK